MLATRCDGRAALGNTKEEIAGAEMTSARIDAAPVRRTQGERSAAMRERVLNAGLQVLREEGYAQASVSRIVERAGVSRGAYLHHFPTKEQLFQE